MILKTIFNQFFSHGCFLPFAVVISMVFTGFPDIGVLDSIKAKEIRIGIDFFAGMPNPQLIIDDSVEIEGIINDMKEMMKTETPFSYEQLKKDLGRTDYRGVIVKIRTEEKKFPIFVRLFKGLIISDKLEKCSSDTKKLENYFVRQILESSRTEHQINQPEIRSKIIKKAEGKE